MNDTFITCAGCGVYLFMALFWLTIGALIQIYWERLQPLMMIPVDRTVMGLICFIMFSYSFIRWRMGQSLLRTKYEDVQPLPRPRVIDEPPNPDFDFSKDEPKKDLPPK